MVEKLAEKPAELMVRFQGKNYTVPEIADALRRNPAASASQVKRAIRRLPTEIANTAMNHASDQGKGGWEARESSRKITDYAVRTLFRNKKFANEFVGNPTKTSDKVLNAVEKNGVGGITSLLSQYRYAERGKYLSQTRISMK